MQAFFKAGADKNWYTGPTIEFDKIHSKETITTWPNKDLFSLFDTYEFVKSSRRAKITHVINFLFDVLKIWQILRQNSSEFVKSSKRGSLLFHVGHFSSSFRWIVKFKSVKSSKRMHIRSRDNRLFRIDFLLKIW